MFSFLVSVPAHISVSIGTLGSPCAFKNGETEQRKTFYSLLTFNRPIAFREWKQITFLQRFSDLFKQKLRSLMHPADTFKGTSPQSWVFSTRLRRTEGARPLEAYRLGSQALPLGHRAIFGNLRGPLGLSFLISEKEGNDTVLQWQPPEFGSRCSEDLRNLH